MKHIMEYLEKDFVTGEYERRTARALSVPDVEALILGALQKALAEPNVNQHSEELAQARMAEGTQGACRSLDELAAKRYACAVGEHIQRMLALADAGFLVDQAEGDLAAVFVLPDDSYHGNIAS